MDITNTIETFEKIDPSEYIVSRVYSPPDSFSPDSWGICDSLQIGKECMGISGSYVVAINVNVKVTVMPAPNQREILSSSLVRDIVSNLLDNRDFLGYQLSYCKGNLTEEKFNSIKERYLTPHNIYDINTLAHSVLLLMKSTSLFFNADQISTTFKCDIDIAEKALTEIVNWLNA